MKNLFLLAFFCFGLVQLSFGQSELVVRKNGELTLIEVTNNQQNVFLGQYSGEQALTGALGQPNALNNTAIGNATMRYLSTGDYNTALGSSALGGVRTGHSNVGIGALSLLNMNDGIWNVGIGRNALLKTISGSGNVGIGREALHEVLLGFNTGVGHEAGRENLGEYNTFLGAWSGRNNTGSNNVYIGKEAGKNILGSNKLVIENSDVDSTQSLIYGEFDNDLLRLNAEVNINGNYTLPTTGGSESQVLRLNGNNEAVWDSLILMDQDSTNELITNAVSGDNQIWLTEGANGHIIYLEANQLVDTDHNTNIFVDKGHLDDNKIRFEIDGSEAVVMERNSNGSFRMEFTDPNDNIAVGDNALLSNNTGIGNTAYAKNALRFNQTGNGNVALGRAAMQFSVSGDYNTFVGDLAGFRNDGGNKNVGLGSLALADNVTGEGNVGLGHFAGYHETGSNKLYIANDSVGHDEALIYGEFDNQLLRVNGELNVNGDYSLPTDTAMLNQFMIMGADGQLRWHSEEVKYTGVYTDWGYLKSTKEIYFGADTTIFDFESQIRTPMIIDQDGDTKIEVQDISGLDEDKIRFQIDGTEKLVLGQNGDGHLMMEFKNNENNTFIGENAGINTEYGENTMMGVDAGLNNTTGFKNTYLGFNSGNSIQLGRWNTFVGSDAGAKTTSGDQNTFFGEVSGEEANGSRNTYLGVGSGRNIQGDRNVAVGNDAGLNATGDLNVLLGSEAGKNANGGNKLYIENTDADSTAALIYGEFNNDKLRLNAEVNISGNYTLPSNTAIPNQMMIMGLDSTLQWYTPGPQLVDVNHEYGYISKKEVTAIGLDTIIESTYYPVSTPMIVDQDGDTKIEVQELNGPDTDKITFQIDSTEKLVMRNNADGHLMMEFKNNEKNTFIGENAGINTVHGRNTMMGVDAGFNNTTGFSNTYLGSSSGNSIQLGQWNTFVGSDAGASTTSGHRNTFIGESSGSDANGERNTYLGVSSGRNIQGDRNVAVGNDAGFNATGDLNVLLGAEAGKNSNGGNKLYIENTDADSTAALIYGEFDNDKLRINGDVGIGVNAEYAIHINDNNARIKLANPSNFGVTFNAFQNFWQARLSNSTNSEVLGVDMTHKTFEPYINDTLTLGTASYKWKEVFATNATINTSDRRFKKNINNMSYGLDEVMQMRPVTYQWKKEANGRMINGFIAQEMEEIVPEVVHVSKVTRNPIKGGTESEYDELYGMRYTELIPVLTKAIQDQQAIIEALLERVDTLEKK